MSLHTYARSQRTIGSHVRSLTWVVAAPAEDSKCTCSQISAVTVLDHQLIPFSQDSIGSVRGSANAITVWSGLNPWRGLIGQWCDMERGRLGCYSSAVQAFIDPPRNTDQHLVVVSQFLIFPMGLVKIAVVCPAPPPTARSYTHGASKSRASLFPNSQLLQLVLCAKLCFESCNILAPCMYGLQINHVEKCIPRSP